MDTSFTNPEGPASTETGGTLRNVLCQLQKNADDVLEAETKLQALMQRQAGLIQARRILQFNKLTSVVADSDLGYQKGKPLAAMLLHRCLVEWSVLDSPEPVCQSFLNNLCTSLSQQLDENNLSKTNVSSNGGATIASPTASMALPDNDPSTANPILLLKAAYWLNTMSTALALLHHHLPPPTPVKKTDMKGAKVHGASGSFTFAESELGVNTSKTIASIRSKFAHKFTNFLKRDKAPADAASDGHVIDAATGTTNSVIHLSQPLTIANPAQAFRHSLELLVLQAYSLVRDTLKKQLTPLMPACIQAPPRMPSYTGAAMDLSASQQPDLPLHETLTTTHDASAKFTLGDDDEEQEAGDADGPQQDSVEKVEGNGDAQGQQQEQQHVEKEAAGTAQDDSQAADVKSSGEFAAWEELIATLQYGLEILRGQKLPRILIKCIFKQLLAFTDAQLFNQLLLRPECCCASNAQHVLGGIQLLDKWITGGPEDAMLNSLWKDLKHVRQAATFLMTPNKSRLTAHDVTAKLCPDLTGQQIYRLCTTFWDDQQQNDLQPTTSIVHPPHTSGRSGRASTESATAANGSAPPQHDAQHDGIAVPAALSAANASAAGSTASAGHYVGGGVADMVSGEVLEALKTSASVHGNGGLIVTFLLDDDQEPIIAPEGCVAPQVLALVESKELYGPIELPPTLNNEECPGEVFHFATLHQAIPDALLPP